MAVAMLLAAGVPGRAQVLEHERFSDARTLSQRPDLGVQRQAGEVRRVPDPLGGGREVHRFAAGPKGRAGKDRVGKAALIVPFATLRPGDHLAVRAEVMIPEGAPRNSVHLMDIECKHCGQRGNPGLRLYLRDGRLRIDRKKIGGRHAWAYDRTPRLAPGRWVEIVWSLRLGLEGDPTLSIVTLDGRTVLRNRGRNLPDLPPDRAGVDRLQIGVTANSNPGEAVVYLRGLELTRQRADR
ncbi:hypothetical protein BV394_04130 [Brevirhabdus pacifica]|uniref:Uncharacterized protein n=2 Tax=Brevirhabdus pacifica TaxID=1267768 RepID=A0A1U7DGE9_9RHOB|nr:hypothetical protein BV394_04130 [Brevirhabdus pacifica]OWU80230.1 hypothetical protein ATO5_04810 [Loktanella sp. 22II-4b]PJJ86419.1 hypothetical protein CLV77_0965 [Brevirhabdus pacifica]